MSGWALSLQVGLNEFAALQNDTLMPLIAALKDAVHLTGSGTYHVPDGVTRLYVTAVGGGGGGGGSYASSGDSTHAGGGGGAGAIALRVAVIVTPGQAIAYTAGAAGSGGAAYLSVRGQSGGNTQFGRVVVGGGVGGEGGGPIGSPTAGSPGAAGEVDPKFSAYALTTVAAAGRSGGSGPFGEGGVAGDIHAKGYGSGGAGKASGAGAGVGGNGAPGFIVVEVA